MPHNLIEIFLKWDENISRRLADAGNSRQILKFFEYSMHGIPWGFGCFVFLLFSHDPIWIQNEMNIMLALIIDLIGSGILKIFVRRRRPKYNRDDSLIPVVDQFSFPSGHTSRTFTFAFILLYCNNVPLLFHLFSFGFGVAVALSRVMLGRHFTSDVLGGFLLGFLQAKVVLKLWLTLEMANNLVKPLQKLNPFS